LTWLPSTALGYHPTLSLGYHPVDAESDENRLINPHVSPLGDTLVPQRENTSSAYSSQLARDMSGIENVDDTSADYHYASIIEQKEGWTVESDEIDPSTHLNERNSTYLNKRNTGTQDVERNGKPH